MNSDSLRVVQFAVLSLQQAEIGDMCNLGQVK